MGDRYYLEFLYCAYCGAEHRDEDEDAYAFGGVPGIYYAPTCGFFDFECEACGKLNYIGSDMDAHKIEDISAEEAAWFCEEYTEHPITEAWKKLGRREK
ncbi:MAG: hypothetical protein WC476_01555 [Phycisphaerae bacterium]|jgi:hypothetical protein